MANEKVMTGTALVEIFEKCLDDGWGYIWGTAGVLWTQARQNQLDKTTDSNRAMSRRYGEKWIGHWVADCSGMFVYAFKQFGKSMSHISSNIYISYCGNKGQLTAALKKTIRPGTAVFTGDSAKKHPHVGLYIGGGYVIEAKGTVAGVVKSSIDEKRWTWWGELKGVQYDGAAPEPGGQEDAGMQTIRKGNKGELVRKLQKMLQELGYSLGICGVDGDFGVATEKAVREFQKDHDGPDGRALAMDGVCGPATWAALEAAVKAKEEKPEEPAEEKYTVTVRGLDRAQAEEICKTFEGATMTKE